MLITLTCQTPNTADLGYLFAKHPGSVFERPFSAGTVWAFYPELSDDRLTIVTRYLRYQRPLIESALERLIEADEAAPDPSEEEGAEGAPHAEVSAVAEQALGLHQQRLEAVMAAVRECGARSLADLGCGEGRLLALALEEPALVRILGMDVSARALTDARRRLRLDTLSEAQQRRITVTQGSLLYRDGRLADFDAAALVEVIEHLDPSRLETMERVVFGHARPRRVIVTTPNREYNAQWKILPAGDLRHADHRFEWTRAECAEWAGRVAARYGYTPRHTEIGPSEEGVGAPSQMVVFDVI